MDKRKILIADPSEDFVMALTGELEECGTIRTCTCGQQVLELIDSFRPDALVLDLALPDFDGLELVEQITSTGFFPAILVVTRFVSDYVIDVITRMGVSYVMYKPCSITAVSKRLKDILEHYRPRLLAPVDPRTTASNLLLDLGIPTKRRGYMYLREAIICYSRNPGQSITKELYPEVARSLGGNGEQVEHLIRTAIAAAWKKRDAEIWGYYFPPDPNGEFCRPSNGTVITRLAEVLYLGEEPVLRKRMCR